VTTNQQYKGGCTKALNFLKSSAMKPKSLEEEELRPYKSPTHEALEPPRVTIGIKNVNKKCST